MADMLIAEMLMDEPEVHVEVAYAKAHEQKIVSVTVKEGTTLREAVRQSGIVSFFPDIDIDQSTMGIFGKTVAKPDQQAVKEGDRIEIYRPLIADPKEVRKRRAEQAKKKAELEQQD
ncbi:RnfH family protein [Endozoicomonas ascidiicola]|uniref:RnfH family protein n=1 Tax=Endozoicomonas ascidiicola TaxID=1698521 RepID=UPI001FDF9CB3|nr:RnfH family protein [Endozoicomonas ascidiicola]